MSTNGNERIRVDSDGLKFNGETAAANALDDYEEGTWTPVDGSGAGLTLGINKAVYTKIGRLVTVQFYINVPSTSSTNDILISGFPFTNGSGGGWNPVLLSTSATGKSANIRIRSGESVADVNTFSGDARYDWADFSNKWLISTMTYQTN